MIQDSYPAGQVEPFWQIRIDGQWLVVGAVIESEMPDGTRYVTIVLKDSELPAIKLPTTAVIAARPPQQLPAVETES